MSPATEGPTPSTARKLGLRPGHEVVLIGAPSPWSLGPAPVGVHVRRGRTTGQADVVVAFSRRLADLQARLPALGRALAADGALWAAWPRRAGGHRSDITDEAVRATLLPLGLVDVKVAALDEDWSALKFVWRRELRAGLASGGNRG